MTRAKQYHLNFILKDVEFFGKRPWIKSDINSDGTIKADDSLLDFLRGGKESTLSIIEDIQQYDYYTYEYNSDENNAGITISGNYGEYGILLSPPPRLAFVGFEIPIEHLLEILNEWLEFLNSIPYDY